jgi:hypothetical protein
VKTYRRAARYFGRRGGILILFGPLWILLGAIFATMPADRFSRPGPGGPLEVIDRTPWAGLMWVLCGLVALINGLVRRRVKNEDAVGYAALIIAPGFWMAAYVVSYGLWLYTHYTGVEEIGNPNGYLAALVYLVLVLAILVIANWNDDLDLPHLRPTKPGSAELALLDAMDDETYEQNRDRGHNARAASEEWITHSRSESEKRIRESADENARRRHSNEHSPEEE